MEPLRKEDHVPAKPIKEMSQQKLYNVIGGVLLLLWAAAGLTERFGAGHVYPINDKITEFLMFIAGVGVLYFGLTNAYFSGKLSNRALTAVLIALFAVNAILLFFYI
ncbi:hypothetical protein WQ57_23680 [Mesobacillus campisalis]|uniref:Uncharacterized protein n=2 Tax=Mesobacillus campisalis TaxID=1408103 RepID=A0A0M2SL64_9BACI|nr:hypothetical protein WQ57_23680 [Mesobacillus campisalis]